VRVVLKWIERNGCEDFEWISLAKDMVEWHAVVKTFTDFGLP
jgi:hypothetical protein